MDSLGFLACKSDLVAPCLTVARKSSLGRESSTIIRISRPLRLMRNAFPTSETIMVQRILEAALKLDPRFAGMTPTVKWNSKRKAAIRGPPLYRVSDGT